MDPVQELTSASSTNDVWSSSKLSKSHWHGGSKGSDNWGGGQTGDVWCRLPWLSSEESDTLMSNVSSEGDWHCTTGLAGIGWTCIAGAGRVMGDSSGGSALVVEVWVSAPQHPLCFACGAGVGSEGGSGATVAAMTRLDVAATGTELGTGGTRGLSTPVSLSHVSAFLFWTSLEKAWLQSAPQFCVERGNNLTGGQ